jgi:cytochrome c553
MAQFLASDKKGSWRSSIRRAATLSLALYAIALPRPALAQPGQADFGSVIAGCEACHGTGGASQNAEIPRLNGQRIDYMLGRLDILGNTVGFVHPNNAMWRTVSGMNDNIRQDIVKYFSAQTPTVPRAGALAAQGRLIYERGAPGENVLACSLCHGVAGEGQGLAPRIAGQHGTYLKAQILEFNSGLRPHGTMNNDAHKLTGAEVEALVDYLGND